MASGLDSDHVGGRFESVAGGVAVKALMGGSINGSVFRGRATGEFSRSVEASGASGRKPLGGMPAFRAL